MKPSLRSHIVSLLIAVAFLAPRVANLHALVHLSEEDHAVECELCDTLVQTQQFDLGLLAVSVTQDTVPPLVLPQLILQSYHIPRELIVAPEYLYNKPPPTV